MIMDVHFSSKTDMWSTPQDTFDALAAEFGPFDLDVCATPENAKCPRYYTREDDGLAQPWTGRCFMNPPYGRTIGQWMRKAYEASQNGATVVCLVPARTDTAWFHSFVTKASQVRFLKGRLKFGGSANSAPFPSMIVVFRNAFDVAQGKVELFPSVQQVIRDPNPSVSGCGKFTTWTPSAGRLDIGGWYDTMVGIQSGSMTLAEFFAKLGITEKDVLKALSANTGDKAR